MMQENVGCVGGGRRGEFSILNFEFPTTRAGHRTIDSSTRPPASLGMTHLIVIPAERPLCASGGTTSRGWE